MLTLIFLNMLRMRRIMQNSLKQTKKKTIGKPLFFIDAFGRHIQKKVAIGRDSQVATLLVIHLFDIC